MNPLRKLQKHGQSVWLDYIRRTLMTSGSLERLIDKDGLSGVTTNPRIFEKAVAGSEDYDQAIADIIRANPNADAQTLYEKLVVEDVQMAANLLRPVYEKTGRADGYVSLELSPALANDVEGSIKKARYFWKLVSRPNLLIKVPATPKGISVIETLIAEGININVTLVFSLSHYKAVSSAYIRGLENCQDPSMITSVVSFFVSRIDEIVDKALEENNSSETLELRGKIAIANSKIVYKTFKETFSGERWKKLEKRGARVQRLLWANTSTKNQNYSDVLYVEELVGPNTVNIMSPSTLNNFRNHGTVRVALEEDLDKSEVKVKRLKELGIDLNALAEKLQEDGVIKFSESYEKLLAALEEKRRAIFHGQIEKHILKLGNYQTYVDARLKSWKEMNFNRRLWERDPTLWFPKPTPEITNRLGWLTLPEIMHDQIDEIAAFGQEVKKDRIQHVILLGMGGSSLAPEVFQNIIGNAPGYPKLTVLDSTHPNAVRAVEKKIDLRQTLFVVASKSGTTLEPNSFFKYFWHKMSQVVDTPGHHFLAITDPGTPLMQLAQDRDFRHVFLATPDVGGRYSAFTAFGLVPAALIGVEIHKLIDKAWSAAEGCAFCVSEQKTPGLALGATLGELAQRGIDKVTFLSSPSIKSFPNWLEQLIAESTGKNGKGILPVVNEPLSDSYEKDRFFVYFSFRGNDNQKLKKKVGTLAAYGHPVAIIGLEGNYDIGREIFRWEVAIALAASVLEIHPFDQPDVELAKELARKVMKKAKKLVTNDVETTSSDNQKGLVKALENWLNQAKEKDYIAIQAYIQPTKKTTELLQRIRSELLNRLSLATTVGYGPRFLHSTGQMHKGGPNNGLFLQIVDETRDDLPVPETSYSFGEIIRAQAIGDYQALKKRGRRILRINLKNDVASGLSRITKSLRGLD